MADEGEQSPTPTSVATSDDEDSPLSQLQGALAGAVAAVAGAGGDAAAAPPAGAVRAPVPARVAPAAPAAPAPAPAGGKKKKMMSIPKDSAAWFKAKRKAYNEFKYTPEGDLQVPEMRGKPASVIKLPWYRPATFDEQMAEEEKQKEKMASVEAEFDELQKQLKEAIQVWRLTGASDRVLSLQADMRKLDMERSQLRSGMRWISTIRRPAIRDILVEMVHEDKKMEYGVNLLKLRTLNFGKTVVAAENPPAVAAAPPAEPEGVAAPAEDEEEEEAALVLFFDPGDPEHGVLSPNTMTEFTYNGTKYTSLIQAYEVERVTQLGRKDARPLLLKARNPKQVIARSVLIQGNVENPRELWQNILTAAAQQNPRIAEVLRATGTDTLVYANPSDTVLGIGLSAENPDAMDKANWKGPNLLGQAWMNVRSALPEAPEAAEDGEEEAAGGAAAGDVVQGGGSADAAAKAIRRGVLMHRYR